MKKNKKERAATKAVAVSTETVKNIKDAVNVGHHEKASTTETPAPVAKKEKRSKKIELNVAPVEDKSKKTLDDKTALSVAKEITDKKELKYIYPANATTLDTRKKFRAEVRRKIASQEKEIAKLMASTLKEDKALLDAKSKEYDAYRAKVILAPATLLS